MYAPVGYVFFADIYCGDCGGKLSEIDPEGNPKGAIFSWEVSEFLDCEDGNGGTYDSSCGECGLSARDWR